MDSDEQLVEEIISNDYKGYACTKLYNRYYHQIRRALHYIVTSNHQLVNVDIDDLLQETFIKAFNNLNNFNSDKGKLYNWIYTIAIRNAFDLIRERKRRKYAYHVSEFSEPISTIEGTPEDSFIEREELNIINDAMSSLPTEWFSILYLRAYHDMSYNEIAKIKNKPLGTIKSILFRSRERLLETCAL